MKYHLTKYVADGRKFAASWVQIDVFGRTFCFAKRVIPLT